ncbi:MAG: hypothetical protein ACI9R3_000967 [Verrucomicrobiales bacterium]|jgi:hypothetical protein
MRASQFEKMAVDGRIGLKFVVVNVLELIRRSTGSLAKRFRICARLSKPMAFSQRAWCYFSH